MMVSFPRTRCMWENLSSVAVLSFLPSDIVEFGEAGKEIMHPTCE